MSQSHSSKALLKTALNHYALIDDAYFLHGGKVSQSEENANKVRDLIRHRLAWKLDEETTQLSSSLIKLLERTGNSAKRQRGSEEIANLWQQLDYLLGDYDMIYKKSRIDEAERLANELYECALEMIEAMNNKLSQFARYIDQGFSTVSDIDLRLRYNQRALKEAEALNDLLIGCNLSDFNTTTLTDRQLRQIFRVFLPRALANCRKELVRVLHDLRKQVTKLQADSVLAKQLIAFKQHFVKNPSFTPTEIVFPERVPAILTQSLQATRFAYPDVHRESHTDIILSAIHSVRRHIQAQETVQPEELSIEDATQQPSTLPDISELYEKSLAVIEVAKRGTAISAAESFEKLGIEVGYNYWLLALLNTVNGLDKIDRDLLNIHLIDEELPQFNGNILVKDIALSLR